MNGRGRPLRFLAAVTIAWIGARVLMLWPSAGSLPAAIEAALPLGRAAPVASAVPAAPSIREPRHSPIPARLPLPRYRVPLADDDPRVQLALMAMVQYGEPGRAPRPPILAAGQQFVPAPERIDPLPNRWSLGVWMVARGEGGSAAAPGGQIGGGQAGVRAAWLIAPRQRVAAYARFAGPLQGKGREAALGLEWQPGRAPVRIIAERRFGLDGSPGGTGFGMIGGVDTEWRGFRLEAYGQAGAVLRKRADPYADGAARGVRTLPETGPVRLGIGAGAWGAAQRDAQRLDLGPTATMQVRNLRFALDWRQRVAGAARPGSGLALTLGADF